MIPDPSIRNIGISAHLAAGRATLLDRILRLTAPPASQFVVDQQWPSVSSRRLALPPATCFDWPGMRAHLVDTPERSPVELCGSPVLDAIDGRILVVCAVAGVQPQPLASDLGPTPFSQLVFVNKCDCVAAAPDRVLRQLRDSLDAVPVAVQLPLGRGADFRGVIDLVGMQAIVFDANGVPRTADVPSDMRSDARAARERLLDTICMFSDALCERVDRGQPDPTCIWSALRQAVVRQQLVPVLFGSAHRWVGIQPLLDAVRELLPAPFERVALPLWLRSAPDEQHSRTGLLARSLGLGAGTHQRCSFLRIFRGVLEVGSTLSHPGSSRTHAVQSLARVYVDRIEPASSAASGEIVAVCDLVGEAGEVWTDAAASPGLAGPSCGPLVVAQTIETSPEGASALTHALRASAAFGTRLQLGFARAPGRVEVLGASEAQLRSDVKRACEGLAGPLRMSATRAVLRESPTRAGAFDFTFRHEAGEHAALVRVSGRVEPSGAHGFEFRVSAVRGAMSDRLLRELEAGFEACMASGPLAGAPVVGVRVVVDDGAMQPAHASRDAIRQAAVGAWRQAAPRACLQLLEPVARVEIRTVPILEPAVIAWLRPRQATIVGLAATHESSTVIAEAPLANMLGFSEDLHTLACGSVQTRVEVVRYRPTLRESPHMPLGPHG